MDLFGYYMWIVEFDGNKPGPEGDFTIHFQDRHLFLDEINDGFLVAQFMKDVMEKVEEHENYEVVGNIKKIKDPEDKDSTKSGEIVALLGSHNKVGQIGILLGYNESDVWEVLGLYPEKFARAVKSDKGILDNYLALLAQNPEEWVSVHVVK